MREPATFRLQLLGYESGMLSFQCLKCKPASMGTSRSPLTNLLAHFDKLQTVLGIRQAPGVCSGRKWHREKCPAKHQQLA
eukprot:1162024-Pelagomonas_calceolata.AAC.11